MSGASAVQHELAQGAGLSPPMTHKPLRLLSNHVTRIEYDLDGIFCCAHYSQPNLKSSQEVDHGAHAVKDWRGPHELTD